MAYAPVNYDNKRYMPDPLRRFTTQVFEKEGMSAEHAGELVHPIDISLYWGKTGYG